MVGMVVAEVLAPKQDVNKMQMTARIQKTFLQFIEIMILIHLIGCKYRRSFQASCCTIALNQKTITNY